MAESEARGEPTVARVDRLIDENAAPLVVPEDSELKIAHEVDESVGGTSPTSPWRIALIGLGIVVVILLAFQLLLGRTGDGVSNTPAATAAQTTQQ